MVTGRSRQLGAKQHRALQLVTGSPFGRQISFSIARPARSPAKKRGARLRLVCPPAYFFKPLR
jgi:hypothetical protein